MTPCKFLPENHPTRAGHILRPIINLAAFRCVHKHRVFAGYFAAVLAIFWPVVFWSLLRIADQMDAQGRGDVRAQVHG